MTGVTGSVAMLEALLPAGPDLTIENRYGGSSPIPAGERGHVDYIRRVIRTGVDLDHVNDLGWTALLEAVILGDGSRRYEQIVTLLVEAGVDTRIADKHGVTPSRHLIVPVPSPSMRWSWSSSPSASTGTTVASNVIGEFAWWWKFSP